MDVGGDPHFVVAVLDLRGDAIAEERIYIAERWPAPEYRAAWVEPGVQDRAEATVRIRPL